MARDEWVGDEGLIRFFFSRCFLFFFFFSFSGTGNGRWLVCFSMGVLLLLLRPMFFFGVDWTAGIDGVGLMG